MISRFRQSASRLARRLSANMLGSEAALHLAEVPAVDKAAQLLLALHYRERLHTGRPLPAFRDVGFRVYSQADEDGLLLFIFALLGTTSKRAVEIGCGDGIECNTANLLVNHGWTGLLIDSDARNVRRARAFYASCRDTWLGPPAVVQARIDRSNVDAVLTSHGIAGSIDLLSLDIDGIDYWVWQAIRSTVPRVVVVEYSSVWGPDQSKTVPYRSDFTRDTAQPEYFGASLAAMARLGAEKGYRLVGCNRYGFNAFFVHSSVGDTVLPAVSVTECLAPTIRLGSHLSDPNRRAAARQLEWVDV